MAFHGVIKIFFKIFQGLASPTGDKPSDLGALINLIGVPADTLCLTTHSLDCLVATSLGTSISSHLTS